MDLDVLVRNVLDRVAREIADAVRRSVADDLRDRFGINVAAPAPAAPRSRPARRRRVRVALDDEGIEQVYQYVKANAGKRSEEIQKDVAIGPERVRAALVHLRQAGRIKNEGVGRATTYSAVA